MAELAGLRSAVVFPILIQKQVWGVIELFSAKPLPLDHSLLATLRSISVQIGQAVERVEAQVQLRLAKDEAIALSAAKGKYVSTVSHEIRTPLNAVIGMTSMIKSLPMDGKMREGILTIEQAAEQLFSIVNNVLDIDRVDAGVMPLDIVNFDVQKMVAHVMRIIRALPDAGALDVSSSIDPDVPLYLIGDQGRINQILINLMSNAVKFTQRGSVRLRVSAEPGDFDRVRMRFEVEDTGIGIKRSLHERIFEAFERVSTASSGTGLGLTICREFAKRMGGELTLESAEGLGSTFTFSVPLQRGSLMPANEAQRLSALHALDLLDSAPALVLNELVAEAARLCQAPIALISLVDENRQWFKAKIGLEANQTPHEQAFCAHAILTPERVMVVPDARADPRFSDNPLVTAEPFIRFYAGAPLLDASGQALGTLCVIDRVPRELSERQLVELKSLAGKAAALLTANPLRVLVAEDTPTSQLVLRLMLEKLGHSVRVVADGEQALLAFAEEPFDLVVLDVQMPVVDGIEATRAIRRREFGGRSVPIVGVSANATQADRQRALASGMTSFLVKPVKLSDIAAVIAELKIRPQSADVIATGHGSAHRTGGLEIEQARLHDLAEQLGPHAMAAALAQFEGDACADLDQLRSSVAAGDSDQVRRSAHRLKGLFAQFGATAAAGQAGELEKAPDESLAKAAQLILETGPGAVMAVRIAASEVQAGALKLKSHS